MKVRPPVGSLARYYMLQSSLQILYSALLDDGMSRAGDLKSYVIIQGFYHIKVTACVGMNTLYSYDKAKKKICVFTVTC